MNNSRIAKTLWLYLGLALGLTWLCWIPAQVLAGRYGYTLPMMSLRPVSAFADRRHALLATLFNLGVYGPLIASVVATALEAGRVGLRDLLARSLKWRVLGAWYLKALGITLALPLIPFILALLMGAARLGDVAPLLLPALVFFLRQLATSGLGEEPGWRGYLLPHLQAHYPHGDKAVWLLGLIWAVWHYPLTIQSTLALMNDAVPLPAAAITLLMGLAGQTISLIGLTYLYVWLYNHTRSVWLMIVFHALSNTFGLLLAAGGQPFLTLLTAAMPWLVVFALEKVYGKDHFPGPAPM
ncbi:MAG TPA: CPBP family intramembrane metalloprotease [Anaerolineae bacterium]|nr:CPBP family intramembrane metalloprotease [Anaerolineae bacterium]